MHTCMHAYKDTYIHVYYIYIYTYITYMFLCIYIYIYIDIHRYIYRKFAISATSHQLGLEASEPLALGVRICGGGRKRGKRGAEAAGTWWRKLRENGWKPWENGDLTTINGDLMAI